MEVRQAMKEAGLTQYLLSEMLGSNETAVYRMLRAELDPATKEKLLQLIKSRTDTE